MPANLWVRCQYVLCDFLTRESVIGLVQFFTSPVIALPVSLRRISTLVLCHRSISLCCCVLWKKENSTQCYSDTGNDHVSDHDEKKGYTKTCL